MKIAIIDLGTNSVRFDIHEINARGKPKLLYREKQMVRLGQGVFRKKRLNRGAISRTLEAIIGFRQIIDDIGANKTVAYATAALREAVDANQLLRRIRKSAGIQFNIISGNQEARLIALGILAGEKAGKAPVSIIDIGGGSTEICVCRGKKIVRAVSLPLGAARLQQKFLTKSPPPRASLAKLHFHLVGVLYETVVEQEWPLTEKMIGSSGTVRTIARVMRRMHHINYIDGVLLKDLVQQMRSMSTARLQKLPGMDPKRVDMILAGAIILERSMDMLHASKVFPTQYTLRDGILIEQIRRFRRN